MMIFITPDTLPRDGFIQPVADVQWVGNILGKPRQPFLCLTLAKTARDG